MTHVRLVHACVFTFMCACSRSALISQVHVCVCVCLCARDTRVCGSSSATEEILAIRKDVFAEGKPEEKEGLGTPKHGTHDPDEELQVSPVG